MALRQIACVVLSTLVGVVFATLFNFFFLDKILIPDPCYYHSHETSIVFDVFYDLPSSEGYHPFPTIINFILTFIIGAIMGLIFSLRKLKKVENIK